MRASATLSIILSFLAVAAEQVPILRPARTNLVDILDSDPELTLLITLLQRARLIPTLNRLEDATLFAPTNDAIKRYRAQEPDGLWNRALSYSWQAGEPDNIQYALRQHLFYHLVNYSLPITPPEFPAASPLVIETLHYPDVPLEPPTHEPPPSPPWLPIPGGLLNSAPQRLRVATRESSSWVGVDSDGKGGARVVGDVLFASNGLVIRINDVIRLPGNLYQEIQRHPLLSEFASLVSEPFAETLAATPHFTLFFPIDSAWSSLDSIERRYLHSGYAERDVGRLIALHSSGSGVNSSGDVGWSDTWAQDSVFTTVEGTTLEIGFAANGTVQVGPSTVVQKDIYASNGVIHIVSSLLIGPDTFQINAEKYLLMLNASSFVSLLRSANLSHYVDDEHDGKQWTILAPRDDVLSLLDQGEKDLSKVLKYHILPGKVPVKDLHDGALIGTELREPGLNDDRQRLRVSVSTESGRVMKDANGEVGFGEAQVISEPVKTDNFIIYVISKFIEPPGTAVEAIEPFSHLSTFLAATYASSMSPTIRTEPSSTVLVPHNDAFTSLGLLTSYLLLPEADSRRALRSVLKHHVIHGVLYANQFESNRTATYKTLEGSSVTISGLSVNASGSWNTSAHLVPVETLTQTGVVHEIRDVLLPSSLHVNIEDLALAAKGSTMISLIRRAGLGRLLNGTLTPKDVADLDPWKRNNGGSESNFGGFLSPTPGWTLLCPTDNAFKRVNLTRFLDDKIALRRLIFQHIIPTFPSPASSDLPVAQPIPFNDEATFTTLLTPDSLHADIIFRKVKEGKHHRTLIGINGARGTDGETDFAQVIDYGRTTTSGPSSGLFVVNARSGVIAIDRVLEPWVPGWWGAWGQQVIVGGGVGVLGILGFWMTIVFFWRRKDEEATYEPLDGEGSAESEVERDDEESA